MRGTISHAREIIDVKTTAVKALCGQDYSAEQVDRWTRIKDLREVENKVARDPTFVAVANGAVVGYSQVAVQSGEILAVYVRPSHVRMGVGAAVLAAAEECAVSSGRVSLWLDASLTAERFYAARGYKRQHSSSFALDSGVELPCVRMTKTLPRR
ncbi:MAG: GNAT family N-acetyltransferase [Deltaproteobacteria bacterium]